MPHSLKLLLIAGARPNFMKIAPLVHAIDRHNAALDPQPSTFNSQPIEYKLVHTGQHYDEKMSEVFFRDLGIPAPDFNLEVGSGSHAVQTANIMARFEPVLLHAFSRELVFNGPSPEVADQSSVLRPPSSVLPDWLVVVGDVNSTMACTLVASKLGIKVAHVEAGLRSFDRTMPEEINRIVTDSLADLLLTPSEDANENLRREGIGGEKIKLVGNIMIDSLVADLPKARASTILQQLNLQPGNFVYTTLHRPSNVDQRESLTQIITELERLAEKLPVVLPLHPRTRKMMRDFGLGWNGAHALRVVEPLGYHDSLCLTEHARLVLTDSGGLQEESTWFRTPCLTLRPNTERPVTVTQGSNRLTSLATLTADISERLAADRRLGKVPAFWDGQAAQRICDSLLKWNLSESDLNGSRVSQLSMVSAQ